MTQNKYASDFDGDHVNETPVAVTGKDPELKFEVEHAEYVLFKELYTGGSFKYLRYGQAFYNHFALHKMTSHKDLFNKLFNLDGEEAKQFIKDHFTIR